MSRAQLIEMARHNVQHAEAGTIDQANAIANIPAEHYYDEEHFDLEMKQVFKRLPLMVAASCEVASPGDYKAIMAVGVPMIISRGKDGELRAFLNMCSHRGSIIMAQGCGNAHRFTCPYHAWNYNTEGELTSVYNAKEFGELDKSLNGLRPLPVLEKAGLIWVVPNPESELDIEKFLCGYDDMLAHFDFSDWKLFSQRTVHGPNWKIAYDGYLDFYHLPILHKDTFGSDFSSQALYYSWGPHQRVSSPDVTLKDFMDKPESEWPTDRLVLGVWTIFPHVSIASFDGGGRGVLISQLFPGEKVGESITVQSYLMENLPDDEEVIKAAHEQFDFLKFVVESEDYATGLRQQQALMSGTKKHVMFGRNEAGGQNFHHWLDRILKADDSELPGLFGKP
jgi:phenylpropionate dioxygenase-like ring-hydroxylating dioxygenase large terminal subunit